MTAPTYVATPPFLDRFVAGAGLPVLTPVPQLVATQVAVDALIAAAARSGIDLRFANSGGAAQAGADPTYLMDVFPGTNVTIDKTDPRRPVINSAGGGGGGTVNAAGITDATAVGRAVLTAGTAALARAATGAGTASTKADVGLGNVDNTSDANKPVSTATATALAAKADTASLAAVATAGTYASLTGKPTIPAVVSLSTTDPIPGGTPAGALIVRT